MSGFRLINLKYSNLCGACGKELAEGTKAWAMKSKFPGAKWHFECETCHAAHQKNNSEKSAEKGLPLKK